MGSAPIQNMPRQPMCCSSRMPTSAASRLPSGMPPLVMALMVFFLPAGAYAATSAAVVASSAPMPRPVAKRSAPKAVVVVAIAVRPMPTENQAQEISITLRNNDLSRVPSEP